MISTPVLPEISNEVSRKCEKEDVTRVFSVKSSCGRAVDSKASVTGWRELAHPLGKMKFSGVPVYEVLEPKPEK
jgi:hypothetical protein